MMIYGQNPSKESRPVQTDADGNLLTAGTATDKALIGALTEAAPANDTASSGLNGRLQRIAQRLTSLIALLPASLGAKAGAASLSVVVANDQTVPVAPVNTASVSINIAMNESLSPAIDLGVARAGAIVIPAGFAWTAASLTALVSKDGVDYVSLYDEFDTEWAILTANIVAGRSRTLPLSLFLPYRYLKFRSGTASAAVNQGAARLLYLIAN